MKKPDLIESVGVVVSVAESKTGLAIEESRHINRLKNWLREHEEAASIGSRGRVQKRLGAA